MEIQTAYDAFMRSRQAIACTESTMEGYRQELGMLLRFLWVRGVTEIEDIDTPALLDYMAWTHQRGVSAATLNSYRMRMGVFVNWCGGVNILYLRDSPPVPTKAQRRDSQP